MGQNLRDRVATNTRPPGTEVETTKSKKPATLAEEVELWQQEFQLAMPKGTEARQLVRDALALMRSTKNLAACTSESVLGGLMTFAQLGLRPGVLGHGWLIPFKTRWLNPVTNQWQDRYVAQVVIGYKGFVELGHRSPSVRKIGGRAVHARDEFHIEYGLDETLVHRPATGDRRPATGDRGPVVGDRGPVVGYYAVIKLADADPMFWHMTRDEVIEWRNRYAMSVRRDRKTKQPVLDADGNVQGDGPWFEMDGPAGGTPFDEMAIKTCFLRAARWMPKEIDRNLARAVEVDGAVRLSRPGTGQAPDPDDMLTAEHPVIDVEPADEQADEPAGEERPPPPPVVEVGMRTEFPPVVGEGGDAPVSQGVTTSIGRMIGKAGTYSDEQRKAIVSRIAGLARPVDSTSKLTGREGRQVLQFLSGWEDAGTLADQVAAIAAATATAAAAPATAEKLPAVGTKKWHDDHHPRRDGDRIARAEIDLEGACGICEEDAATR